MTQTNLRQLAAQYLKGLEMAGVTDLPTESEQVLGQLLGQVQVDAPKPESAGLSLPAEPTKAVEATEKAEPAETTEPTESVSESKQDFQAAKSIAKPAAQVGIADAYGPSPNKAGRIAKLQVLAQQVSACSKCEELAKCRTQTVFGVGSPKPRLAFFGEGPGADEDRLGEPFVGRAGELLNKIIGACKMTREEVYIFNTVKCRPPGNRNPHETELQNCREHWQAQLEILQPEFICCLGSVAARTLLDSKESVGRMRGKFHQYRSSQVVVTYHPAYLLRTPEAKAKTWDDMKMLMKAMGVEL